MRRTLVVLVALAVGPVANVEAQQSSEIHGSVVRVSDATIVGSGPLRRTASSHVGVARSLDGDTLTLVLNDGRAPMRLLLDESSVVELENRTAGRRGSFVGLVAGAVVGGVLGYARYEEPGPEDCHRYPDFFGNTTVCPEWRGRGEVAAGGAVGGGLAGFLVGRWLGGQLGWTRVAWRSFSAEVDAYAWSGAGGVAFRLAF